MENWLYYLIPVVFIGIVLYVYRPWARKRYQKDAEIPFDPPGADHPSGDDRR
ncbi:MAG: CcoQ/FixQ family Cbb3-type cytochrome c oxidase assembly chaperone [Thiothrix sp.]|nr:CcoQ/FixQ family Cbb3-type cytochrome c oxidase assembly chaperone [Thiothrix sp.]HPQ94400.1 CcoQ/FixQ family Cbb3-type cytochrome c oxidase assembly chaperone [Thiolinea sp.]